MEKIKKIEKEILELKQPQLILSKVYVDADIIKQASKNLFDFDIEKFISKKDLKLWKK